MKTHRAMSGLVLALALLLAAGCGEGTPPAGPPDAVAEVLDKAKAHHAWVVAELNKGLARKLSDRVKEVSRSGNLDATRALADQLEAFEQQGRLPTAPALGELVDAHVDRLREADRKLIDAYELAIKAYTRELKIDQAEAARSELLALQAEASKRGAAFIMLDHGAAVYGVLCLGDGARVATAGGNKAIVIWDWRTGAKLNTLVGHGGAVRRLVLSPDGGQIASASDDKSVRVWGLADGKPVHAFGGRAAVKSVAYTADGARLVAGCEGGLVRYLDLETQRPMRGWPTFYDGGQMACTPHGNLMAVGAKTLHLYDMNTMKKVRQWPGHTDWAHQLAFSPDGRWLVSCARDRTIRQWDPHEGKAGWIIKDHGDGVSGVAYSPDGARLLSSSPDRTVRLWDAATGDKIAEHTRHGAPVTCVAVTADGRWGVSGDAAGKVVIWRLPVGG